MTDISKRFATTPEDVAESLPILEQHLIDIGFPAGSKVMVLAGSHTGETGRVYGVGPDFDTVAVQNPAWGNQQPSTDWEFCDTADLMPIPSEEAQS